ncbi:DUF4118 domain-containing protein [Streptomyces sp. NPDC007172]|uniref:DUF4118 domain-containing protein n=1 Tax=Streptomyces sp. NPDC007172 TaxID=3364776 RepID=UPI00368255D4
MEGEALEVAMSGFTLSGAVKRTPWPAAVSYRGRDQLALVAAVAGPLAVAAALVPLRTHLASTNLALVLVVAVVAVAANGHRGAGALAALSSAAWFDFFLTRPYERFTISSAGEITTAVLLLVVGLAVSQLAVRARRLKVVSITEADHLARIHETARLAQQATSANAVVAHVREQLIELLALDGCRFEYGTLLGHPPQLGQDGEVTTARGSWEVERRGWPQGEEIELRAFGKGRYYGRYMLRPGNAGAAPLPARMVAVTLAGQAGAALAEAMPGGGD